MTDIRKHLLQAIRLAGNDTRLAKATGYTQNAIWRAKQVGRVSPLMAIAIHKATNGIVPGSVLCPHLWKSPKDVPVPSRTRERA